MKTVKGDQVKKTRTEYVANDIIAIKKNAKAKNILTCGHGPDEFTIVLSCTTAKQIWDALFNAYKGTNQVREFRVVIFLTDYKTFKINKGDTLYEMITQLTTIVNELSFLGKTLIIKEQVYKVLNILRKTYWDVKVTVIREAKDPATIIIDELVENLKTYEMKMLTTKKVETKDKLLALKASESDASDLDKEQVELITKNLKNFFRGR